MKKPVTLLFFLVFIYNATAQNTFPATGNVGIGTTAPVAKLSFNNVNDGTNLPDGITWYNPSPLDFGIYRGSGAWNAPDYQQLNLNFQTGITLNPGTAYGKSYVDVRGGGLRVNAGTASPINATGLFQMNYSANAAFSGALIKNSNAGNVSYAELTMYNDIDKFGQLFFTGSNYSANPAVKPNAAGIYSGGSGGISFLAGDAAAPITFGTSNINRMIIDPVGNVGIGTTTPNAAYKLDVNGPINATNILINGAPISGGGASQWATSGTTINYAGGNVGIGTTAPQAKFEVVTSGASISHDSFQNSDVGLFLRNSNSVSNNFNLIAFGDASGYGVADIGTINNHTNHSAKLFFATRPDANSYPQQRMLIDETGKVGIGTLTPAYKLDVAGPINATSVLVNGVPISGGGASQWATNGTNISYSAGNVGIGTASPNQKLTVNGTIYGKEVKVDLSVPGPDYVFEKDYHLMSLEETKTYIDANKHLPEVPSAKEMEKNGVQLGEMNMLLLKKVEELTLYIIELEKRIKEVEKKK